MPSPSDLAECLQLQREEVETLEAIYTSEVVSSTFDPSASAPEVGGLPSSPSYTATVTVIMHIDFAEGSGGQPRMVRLVRRPSPSPESAAEASGGSSPSASATSTSSTFSLSHLPPLTLTIAYPPSYPSHSPPVLLSATTPPSSPYLDPTILTSTLPELLASTYEVSAPDACLWTFLELVRTGEFLSLGRDGADAGDVLEVCTVEESEDGLKRVRRQLEAWDRGMRGEGFERTTFGCGICLEERKGKRCLELGGCGHVFCRPCLTSCWTIAIEEGDVASVACPSVDCVKKRALAPVVVPDGDDTEPSGIVISLEEDTAAPEADFGAVVKDLLGEETHERWARLTEKKRIESDPTFTFCPISTCQSPVPAPPASELTHSGSRWSRYRSCPVCSFSFCLFCRLTWHGVHTPCPLPSLPPFLMTYLEMEEGDPGRAVLERRYGGRRVLEKMAREAVEDMGNKKWLEERTRACGNCGVRVEKSHGCNHMTCKLCLAHFCFSCGKPLDASSPYKHYQVPGTPCFEGLFDQAEVAAFNRGVQALPGAEEVAAPQGGEGEGAGDEGEWEDPAGFARLGLGDGWGGAGGGVDPLVGEFGGRAGRRRWEGM